MQPSRRPPGGFRPRQSRERWDEQKRASMWRKRNPTPQRVERLLRNLPDLSLT